MDFAKMGSATSFLIAIVVIMTLSLSHVTSTSLGPCPRSCDCHVTGTDSQVTCSNQSLNSIPIDVPSNATKIDVSRNRISSLAGVFQHFQQVQIVDLGFNNLDSVKISDFNSSFNITELNLSSNNITKIDANAFTNMPKLKTLNLSNNSIVSLHSAIFAGLHNLEELHIQDNEIKELSKDIFAMMDKLTTLDLGNNDISEIHADSFTNLSSLMSLDLSFNSIRELKADMFNNRSMTTCILRHNLLSEFDGESSFSGVASLQLLDLSNNMLENITHLTFPALRHLNISWNQLADIDNELFDNVENLTELILDGNPIREINTAVFRQLTSLQTLSMSFMPNMTYLCKRTFDGLDNLQTLMLHHSPTLSFIHKQLFSPLPSIRTLDLSYNSINVLYNASVDYGAISSLNLRGNVFTCDCSLQWLIEEVQANASVFSHPDLLQCILPMSNDTQYLLHIQYLLDVNIDSLHCSDVVIVNHTSDCMFKIGRSAILRCDAESDPSPEITWILPHKRVLKYHDFHELAIKDYLPLQDKHAHKVYHSSHDWHEQPSYYAETESRADRVIILQDGSLYIDYVMRSDAGPYTCIAENPRNSTQVTINVLLDYSVMSGIYIWSLIIGFSSAGSFFLLQLTYSLTLAAIRRCVSQRRRERIGQLMETMYHYKTAQLTRIKENYSNQVGRIRDQYHYSLGRLREHHHNQVSRMGRMRTGASNKMDKLKDNYNGQLGRLKDYSSSQLVQLRERYNSQVDRIKDYGNDKLDKIHEKYKCKQQHVIKILDMMNMDKCRNVFESECVRTESMILQSEGFNSPVPIHSPIESASVSDSEYMTATSTESSKYSSQRNVNQAVDADSESDAPIMAPLNPYIPDPPFDPDTQFDDVDLQFNETSFIDETCTAIDKVLELEQPVGLDNLDILKPCDERDERKRRYTHKRRKKRFSKPDSQLTDDETQRLYAEICDSDSSSAKQGEDVVKYRANRSRLGYTGSHRGSRHSTGASGNISDQKTSSQASLTSQVRPLSIRRANNRQAGHMAVRKCNSSDMDHLNMHKSSSNDLEFTDAQTHVGAVGEVGSTIGEAKRHTTVDIDTDENVGVSSGCTANQSVV